MNQNVKNQLLKGNMNNIFTETKNIKQMEQEIKITLVSRKDYDKVCDALGHPSFTKMQQNYFFDTKDKRLCKDGSFLRLRVKNDDLKHLTLTWKSKRTIVDGISKAVEKEESLFNSNDGIDLNYFSKSVLLGEVCTIYNLKIDESPFLPLVDFKNKRKVYFFEGEQLELDCFQTKMENYEIEIETIKLEETKQKLLQFLNKLGVKYTPSTCSKFETCMKHI